jgi:hypothetical protein
MVTCELCGGRIRSDNKRGVCQRNPECLKENRRREYENYRQSCLERVRKHREANPEYDVEWRRRNPEYHREYQKRRREADRHDDLTYLRYSPGLRLHKIGHTTNLTDNHRALRRGCPDIELVATFPYGIELERWLHRHFTDKRITGTEWFTVTEVEVRTAVKEFESSISIKGFAA